MTDKKIYITTPIYYANASPHIGHFLTTTLADVLARYYRKKLGPENVFFTTGMDEHGTTVETAAKKAGAETYADILAYVDSKAQDWKQVFDSTQISADYFVRTTNKLHIDYVQSFIKRIEENGYIYKNQYKGKYCEGCEKFLTLSDLTDEGTCPLHRPDQVIDTVEENYFFKLSEFGDRIVSLLEQGQYKIIPDNKKNEVLARVSAGLEDISISRPREKINWGIPYPGNTDQTIYVWVDALLNYLSSLTINSKDKAFWQSSVHFLGKDINWFHNVIWPALLLAAGESVFKESFVHSFLNISGQKISKSKGNVISPEDFITKYGPDGARYLVISTIPYKDDVEISWEYYDQKYNADLANGLGNTYARLAKLAQNSGLSFPYSKPADNDPFETSFAEYKIDEALQTLWRRLTELDKHININEPWAIKDPKQLESVLSYEITEFRAISEELQIFLPTTSEKILEVFSESQIKYDGVPLFQRV